jgi:hypothetical protein
VSERKEQGRSDQPKVWPISGRPVRTAVLEGQARYHPATDSVQDRRNRFYHKRAIDFKKDEFNELEPGAQEAIKAEFDQIEKKKVIGEAIKANAAARQASKEKKLEDKRKVSKVENSEYSADGLVQVKSRQVRHPEDSPEAVAPFDPEVEEHKAAVDLVHEHYAASLEEARERIALLKAKYGDCEIISRDQVKLQASHRGLKPAPPGTIVRGPRGLKKEKGVSAGTSQRVEESAGNDYGVAASSRAGPVSGSKRKIKVQQEPQSEEEEEAAAPREKKRRRLTREEHAKIDEKVVEIRDYINKVHLAGQQQVQLRSVADGIIRQRVADLVADPKKGSRLAAASREWKNLAADLLVSDRLAPPAVAAAPPAEETKEEAKEEAASEAAEEEIIEEARPSRSNYQLSKPVRSLVERYYNTIYEFSAACRVVAGKHTIDRGSEADNDIYRSIEKYFATGKRDVNTPSYFSTRINKKWKNNALKLKNAACIRQEE